MLMLIILLVIDFHFNCSTMERIHKRSFVYLGDEGEEERSPKYIKEPCYILELPAELLCLIYSYLNAYSKTACRLTCKRFRSISASFCQLIIPFDQLETYPQRCSELSLDILAIHGVFFGRKNSSIPKKCLQSLPPALKYVDLSFSQISLNTLSLISPLLERLSLICCEGLKNEHLKNLPSNLKELKLSGCKLVLSQPLETWPAQLENLWLDFCDSVVDSSLSNLPTSLKYLNLCNCKKITDSSLSQLPPKLEVCNSKFNLLQEK